ncbi:MULTISPECIES: GNAT family N-acetyltransferase [Saccharibacillus]|jgi:RimJ/RimL family protein N-acetyltransferase|uniref:GNAT family N-acetyltransferase n=1 Tax=Saccharibacillus brassicae TaxID=2583377 RepID=A0A4Y6UV90_SACBS|nr:MULTISPECIES: GNAT family protein [Saccharibacillus]MWJ31892.1 GNAT family N-acetyltransferase [Saccharibacillus sp. WB 17]QDH21629.1 GNAT family N-acetyltransferase [Saccharibacillus brassicae]
MYSDQELTLRPVEERDSFRLWELIYKDEQPEWKKWDAPYYPHEPMAYEKFLPIVRDWVGDDDFWVIEVDGVVRGSVSYYWEHEPSRWLEVGILLHESGSWNKGLGTRALRLWVDHLFAKLPLVRIGYSTWSGNDRMIRVGEKLGMQMEARIRKARFYDGQYYDSIRMGMLREEWTPLP